MWGLTACWVELGLGPYPCSALARCPCVIHTLSNLPRPCGPAGGLPSCVCPAFIYTLSLWSLVSQLLSAHSAHTRRVFTTYTDSVSLFPCFNLPPPQWASVSELIFVEVLCKLQFPPTAPVQPTLFLSPWQWLGLWCVFCICVILCGSHQSRVLKLVQVETCHSIKYKLHFKDSGTHRSKQVSLTACYMHYTLKWLCCRQWFTVFFFYLLFLRCIEVNFICVLLLFEGGF